MAGEWPRRQMTLRHDGSHRIIGNSRIYIYLSFSLYIYIYIYVYIYIIYIYMHIYYDVEEVDPYEKEELST